MQAKKVIDTVLFWGQEGQKEVLSGLSLFQNEHSWLYATHVDVTETPKTKAILWSLTIVFGW